TCSLGFLSPTAERVVMATATDRAGNTSEFSPPLSVSPPAQLLISSIGELTYTAGAGAANRLTISQTGGVYTFHDDGEPIVVLNNDPVVSCSGSGTHTVTVSRGVNKISVDVGDQLDTVNMESIGVPTTIDDTGGGDDTVNVGNQAHGVQDITAPLLVKNTASHTALNVDDSADLTDRTWLVTA